MDKNQRMPDDITKKPAADAVRHGRLSAGADARACRFDGGTVDGILDILTACYPDAAPELNFSNPYETVVATILSAQCTDRQVNRVTGTLFKRYPDAHAMAAADRAELEALIHPCGFFKTKAAHILEACGRIVGEYGGQVPGTMEELLTLPGVGRKTANVVLANAFGADAIAVDTHVFRVSNRIGLVCAKDVEHTEQQLMRTLPKARWSHAHHLLIFHGRRCCHARKPNCEGCALNRLCEYYGGSERDAGGTLSPRPPARGAVRPLTPHYG